MLGRIECVVEKFRIVPSISKHTFIPQTLSACCVHGPVRDEMPTEVDNEPWL